VPDLTRLAVTIRRFSLPTFRFKARLKAVLPFICLCAILPAHLLAQSITSTSSSPKPAPAASAPTAVNTAAASVGGVDGPADAGTFVKGFNASIVNASQHDSAADWSDIFTPDVSYTLNSHLGIDFSFPYYPYLDTYVVSGTLAAPKAKLIIVRNVIGDAMTNLHITMSPSFMDYVLTVSGGFPIGNTAYGLSSQQYTYNFNNHFDKSLGIFSPEIELGFGNSSSLADHRVVAAQVNVGNLAYFMAGTSMDLPFNMSFTADAYEQMPVENLNKFKTTGTGRNKRSVLTGTGPPEDNGFETNLDIPLNPHIVLSGFYNRSLRQHDDTAGFSFTFLMRAPRHKAESGPAPAPVSNAPNQPTRPVK
jgi:hypothetical protein